MNFYDKCEKIKDSTIVIDLCNLVWIDANMVAILSGLVYKLREENTLDFVANLDPKKNTFEILFVNGFLNSDGLEIKNTGTSIKLRNFSIEDIDEYVEYVENDLVQHNDLHLNEESREIIISALIEIFANYEAHSNTKYPLFVCGQYFPKKTQLKFSIFDLGVGFLDPINKVNPKIITSEEAISWALVEGNSSKTNMPGGCGLYDLKVDLLNNNGSIDIASGETYKSRFLKNGKEFDLNKTLNCNNIGTTINLFFNCN